MALYFFILSLCGADGICELMISEPEFRTEFACYAAAGVAGNEFEQEHGKTRKFSVKCEKQTKAAQDAKN